MLIAAVLFGSACGARGVGSSPASSAGPERLALVYRGDAACEGCPEAAAALLNRTGGFTVRYVGPDGDLALDATTLAAAALYVQPGGGDDVELARRQMDSYAPAIANYVNSGGRYLGICMGAFLAGTVNGFGLWPGEIEEYSGMPNADIHTDADVLVPVRWGGRDRQMYFQGGPYFTAPASTVLARYTNDAIAAFVAPSGRGRIALVGPHPEAPQSWYTENELANPDGIDDAPGRELVAALMAS